MTPVILPAYRSWMSGPPAGLANKDLEHLRLLSIFHYIVGAVTAIWLSFPLIHVFIGLVLLLDPNLGGARGEQLAPARAIGGAFIVIGGAIVAFGWTLGALTAYAGWCIRRHQRWLFCVVVACINCVHMPIGTALGVFTLIVLTRASVKQLFQAGEFGRH